MRPYSESGYVSATRHCRRVLSFFFKGFGVMRHFNADISKSDSRGVAQSFRSPSAYIHPDKNVVASPLNMMMRPWNIGVWISNKITSFFSGGADRGRGSEEPMVYVQRDDQGRLLRVEYDPFEGMTDVLAVESDELRRWLAAKEEVKARLDSLHNSDLELVRVLEDVVIVLVDRGVIQYTDLPEAARMKLDERAVARADIEGLYSVLRDKSVK